MTRKYFEAIARIFANRVGYNYSSIDFDAGYNLAVEQVAQDMADYFEGENSNFDRVRFMKACGYED